MSPPLPSFVPEGSGTGEFGTKLARPLEMVLRHLPGRHGRIAGIPIRGHGE